MFLKAPAPGIKGGQMQHSTVFLQEADSPPGCRVKLKSSGNPEHSCLRGQRRFSHCPPDFGARRAESQDSSSWNWL